MLTSHSKWKLLKECCLFFSLYYCNGVTHQNGMIYFLFVYNATKEKEAEWMFAGKAQHAKYVDVIKKFNTGCDSRMVTCRVEFEFEIERRENDSHELNTS